MLFPDLVLKYMTNPAKGFDPNSAPQRLIMACFGAQATLQGVLLATCTFEKRTYKVRCVCNQLL